MERRLVFNFTLFSTMLQAYKTPLKLMKNYF